MFFSWKDMFSSRCQFLFTFSYVWFTYSNTKHTLCQVFFTFNSKKTNPMFTRHLADRWLLCPMQSNPPRSIRGLGCTRVIMRHTLHVINVLLPLALVACRLSILAKNRASRQSLSSLGSHTVCSNQVARETNTPARDKFASRTNLAVSSIEFCQSIFDERDVREGLDSSCGHTEMIHHYETKAQILDWSKTSHLSLPHLGEFDNKYWVA